MLLLLCVVQMLEGDNKFNCQHCAKKVDTLKRCCIADLPNNLILHLKRFEVSRLTERSTCAWIAIDVACVMLKLMLMLMLIHLGAVHV